MKISYRTHPIVEKLENRKLGTVLIKEEDYLPFQINQELVKGIFKNLSNNKFAFFYLTEPFIEAYNKASHKLTDSTLWSNIKEGSYCFLFKGTGVSIDVKNSKEEGILSCQLCGISVNRHEEKPLLEFIGEAALFYDVDADDNGLVRTAGFSGFESNLHKEFYKSGIIDRLCTWLMLILFTKYAEIEIKHLPANKRVKEQNCKYVNDTASNIQVLDSTWFTTLVKSDAFKVRGHFRLQPCGEGMKDRKLIWISDFEKQGYVRNFKRPINIES